MIEDWLDWSEGRSVIRTSFADVRHMGIRRTAHLLTKRDKIQLTAVDLLRALALIESQMSGPSSPRPLLNFDPRLADVNFEVSEPMYRGLRWSGGRESSVRGINGVLPCLVLCGRAANCVELLTERRREGIPYSPVRVEEFARRSGETASQSCIRAAMKPANWSDPPRFQ